MRLPPAPDPLGAWGRALVSGLALLFLAESHVSAGDVSASLRLDPQLLAGSDENGNVLLYAPGPVEPGSSISHWDPESSPNLLMEPSINPDLAPFETDLTTHLLRDIGWSTNGTSTFNINYIDGADEGFNDPSLGPGRRSALEATIQAWAQLVRSSVTINVDARFDPLTCGAGGAVLGQAGPAFMFNNFASAPFANTWYPGALAEAFADSNLSASRAASPDAGDLTVAFNSGVDDECLGQGVRFHYGMGAAPPGSISFVGVAMHEIGHGLGFLNFVNEATGALALGVIDIYSRFTFDNTQGLHWHEMTNQQRQVSATNDLNVVWDGPRVRAAAGDFLGPAPVLAIHSPAALAGTYRVGTAQFGPPLNEPGVDGDLSLTEPALACAPLSDPGTIQGKIAVVLRGDCFFVDKVRNAQAAGAIGVVVVNNQAGRPPQMGGVDPSLQIPVISVSQEDGEKIMVELERTGSDPPEEPRECTADAVTLCLNDGRFEVTLDWMTMDGNSGLGQASRLTDDTGYFWFFNSENVEAVVKALDGCAINDHFWVFAGGLTNVEAELRVVDTDTGQVTRYSNPLGTPFQPVQDTNAFATCP